MDLQDFQRIFGKKEPKVLVVDDDAMTAEIESEILSKENFKVVVCSDGYSALLKLQKEEFDVVELNLHSIEEFSQSGMGKLLINKEEKEYHYFVTNEKSPLKKFAEEIVFDVSDGDMGNT